MFIQTKSHQNKRIIFQRSMSNEENQNILDRSFTTNKSATMKQINQTIRISSIIQNRISFRKNENQQQNYEVLNQKQKVLESQTNLERMNGSKILIKRNELDSQIAIIVIFLLFILTFHLAPNQHYQPSN